MTHKCESPIGSWHANYYMLKHIIFNSRFALRQKYNVFWCTAKTLTSYRTTVDDHTFHYEIWSHHINDPNNPVRNGLTEEPSADSLTDVLNFIDSVSTTRTCVDLEESESLFSELVLCAHTAGLDSVEHKEIESHKARTTPDQTLNQLRQSYWGRSICGEYRTVVSITMEGKEVAITHYRSLADHK